MVMSTRTGAKFQFLMQIIYRRGATKYVATMENGPTIYLDYQATTPVDPRVLDEMIPYFNESFGNPHSSDHAMGWQANDAIERARQSIASRIGADQDEVVFTSGATEANNLAILGCARGSLAHKRHKILISAIEHKCVFEAAYAAQEAGMAVEIIPVDYEGKINLEVLQAKASKDVALVSIMTVNNEVGTVQDIASIANICKDHGILFHTDAAQALSTVDVDVNRLKVDLLSISGHKVYGPKGIGALFIRREIQQAIKPIMFGGGQEFGIRPGTLPTPLCVGLAKAITILSDDRSTEADSIIKKRNALFSALKAKIPGIELTGPPLKERHVGNLSIFFPSVDAHQLIGMLQPHVAVSSGSACTSGIPGPSHVLLAMGFPREYAQNCVRISVGRFTTDDEIAFAAKIIAEKYDMALNH